MTDELAAPLSPEILSHYGEGLEQQRLRGGTSRLELARTQHILRRFLPPPPARILDIGGGPGAYTYWLTAEGYTAHLVDVVPRHVEEARSSSNGYTVALGDARSLAEPDTSADAVLLFGPLYHLIERTDRLRALTEARRVLRPGGHLFGAAISRFASLLDGLRDYHLDDLAFGEIVERDLREGQHRNPQNRLGWFTTAYLHHPDDLAQEIREAGFSLDGLLAIEGPCWLLPDFDARWRDERRRRQILEAVERIEGEPSMLGVSAHLLAVARRPAG